MSEPIEIQDLHDRFPRGHGRDEMPTGPNSTFMLPGHVKQAKSLRFQANNPEGRIFLGLLNADVREEVDPASGLTLRHAVGGTPIGVGDDRHVITIAGSRAGKGRAALTPNLLSYPGSVLVVDPKGDLADSTARYRSQSLGQTVYVLDPFGASTGSGARFQAKYNPLTFLDPDSDTLIEDAGMISDALVIPSGGDPHWDESARNFIEGLVLHVATSPAYANTRHLPQVYDLLMKAMELVNDEFPLEEEMRRNTAAGGGVVTAATDFYDKADRERDSVLSTARRHLRFLGYRSMRRVLSDSSFDLKDLKRKNVSIYLSLPAMRMGTCSRWLRLFVNLTLAAMEQEQLKPRHAVLMCLDEFAVLGTMKTIEDAAGQIAGLGVKLWPILQDLGQLKALYKDRWETFMGNAGVLQFFGNSDLTTLEWISKRLGQTTVLSLSQSSPTYDAARQAGATGKSWSYVTQDLMTPEEVSRFFGRDDYLLRQLIFRPSWLPMVLQRAYYDKHALFKGLFE